MTSRDLAPLPLRRIGRVTDALSLRPVYDGEGREETGGVPGRRGYRRNIAATGQGRRAASLAFVRAKGGYTPRLAARRTDSSSLPFRGRLYFSFFFLFSFLLCFSRLPRDISRRQIVFATERNYKLNLSPNCDRMNTSYVTGTNSVT